MTSARGTHRSPIYAEFPIDVLKIDQTFVSGMAETKESAAIVHTLVQLGKLLGLETIAEGIETHDQWMRLKAEEVDNGRDSFFLNRWIEEKSTSC